MNRFLQFLLILCLLVGAYALGGWKSKDSTDNSSSDSISTQIEDQASNLTRQERSTINLFERAAPSVVFITTTTLQRDFWSMRAMEIPQGTGSGFFWDKSGHIVTNYHVIQNANKISVTLSDQSTHEAIYIGGEPSKDLAVIKIKNFNGPIRPIPTGKSDQLRVGQSAYAIGNPFGLDHTLTTGIVSALGREINSVSGTPIEGVIQTDAAINPGNSGGPLLNSSGQLIGVNTAIYSPSGAYAGIGFSIPVNVVEWVVPDLIQYGRLNRPILGVQLATEQMKRRLRIKEGALIWSIEKNGPADKMGLLQTRQNNRGNILLGDIILGIEDQKITNNDDYLLELEKFKPGDLVEFVILRNNKMLTKEIELGSQSN